MLLDGINSVLDSLQKTNGKLATLNSLLEAGEAKLFNGKLNFNKVEIKTIHAERASISIGIWKKQGDRYPNHVHENTIEYLICTKGSFGLSLPHGYRIINYKDCASIPENMIHSVVALEDDSEMIGICVPSDEAYKRSMECQEK